MRYVRARTNQGFRVTNPTWGTGIAQSIVTGFDATKPILTVHQPDPLFSSDPTLFTPNGTVICLDYIKLICSAAGAGTTSAHLAMVLDNTDRYSSAGSRLTTTPGAVKPNTRLTDTAKARIDFGAIVAIAPTSFARQIARDVIKTQAAPCWTVGDEVYIKFDTFDFSPALTSGAATAMYGVPTGPCIIAPQTTLLVYLWNVANATTPPSWEIEMAWWEAQDRG